MEYRRLGNSGLKVSALSFGSWVTFSTQLDIDKSVEIMTAAYDAGINFFDNAEVYAHGQSETIMGKVLRKTGWARDSYIVSSKVMFGCRPDPKPTQHGLSRKHVVEACHQALKRLQVDYLDLYFCHRPDPETPIQEVVRTMNALIQQGKVLYWGTSEWAPQQILEAHVVAERLGLEGPTMEQPHYNMFVRENVEMGYARIYQEYGLGTTTWSPLYSGILTGKYNAGIPDDSRMNLPGYEWLKERLLSAEGQHVIAKTQELTKIAEELGTSMAKMAIAWCLKNPHVSTVILGASRVSQLQENLAALEVVPLLTDDVMAQIEAILDNKPKAPDFYI